MNKLKDQDANNFFPEADQALADYFTISQNNWHNHTGVQVLIATDGVGYYQERGKPVQVLNHGDVVFILPHVEHWHIAAPQSDFTNVTIAGEDREELVTWLQRATAREHTLAISSTHQIDNTNCVKGILF